MGMGSCEKRGKQREKRDEIEIQLANRHSKSSSPPNFSILIWLNSELCLLNHLGHHFISRSERGMNSENESEKLPRTAIRQDSYNNNAVAMPILDQSPHTFIQLFHLIRFKRFYRWKLFRFGTASSFLLSFSFRWPFRILLLDRRTEERFLVSSVSVIEQQSLNHLFR